MELYRDDDVGFWKLEATDEEWELKPDYIRALPLYLNGLDSIFARAREQDEAQLILSLLGIKGLQAAGWDPYDTTIDAIQAATRLHNETEDRIAAWHLSLWVYGHIVEAAAPYDLLANLINVAKGGQAGMAPFATEGGRTPTSPGRKLELIGLGAEEIGNQAARPLLAAIWHRQLRNGVFHADYTLHGSEIRLVGDGEVLSLGEFAALSGRAHGYHDAMRFLRRYYRGLYTEPRIVPAGPIAPGQNLTIIVREGYGAVGIKDALTPTERAAGGIPFRYARLFPDEMAMIDGDPELALLPARPEAEKG
ncbi:MAG TPA: hypothetical protein VFE22_03480 [Edaphobacter sp.]|nr:hypothetical protein [Edaphobacter sp.]